jgi:4-hydroxythreonine-4-phosphate dehydrogenase
MAMRKTLLITPGDPEGIGPEVFVKAYSALGLAKKTSNLRLVVIGGKPKYISYDGLDIETVEAPSGKPGFQCGWSIEEAVRRIQAGESNALVTGPISKSRLQDGGYPYRGHTDFLAHLTGGLAVTMMMASPLLKISLVTDHVPLFEVPTLVNFETMRKTIENTLNYLRTSPAKGERYRIAVLGLNPHAGESGKLGAEEIQIIEPALAQLRDQYADLEIEGPFPADTFFARPRDLFSEYDATIALYHDQGLIPIKTLDFDRTVNITLGLPFVRISVDHGTAFDIAAKNQASSGSMEQALRLAILSLEGN